MTAAEDTMTPETENRREQLAAEAAERIQTGQHWSDWRFVCQGFEVGRNKAMREAYSNEPMGRRYNEAFGKWLNARPWARLFNKVTRAHCLWCADHLPEIEAWRETLAANQREQWNHPSVIKRQYERAHRVAAEQAAGIVPTPKSPTQQLKDSLIEVETDRDRWKRQAEEVGSHFDLRRDTPEQIARILVEVVTPSRAENIAKAIRAELKRQKAAHAG
jgi:hypothetical protein